MIKIENVETAGWEAAIRGMRNPMNSWGESDSYWGLLADESPINPNDEPFFYLGENDIELMRTLSKAGTDHRKFMRMIAVYADITAPLYWWKEYDTYKVGSVANSCSTMHKIHEREFTFKDFSTDHLGIVQNCDPGYWNALETVIGALNEARKCYLDTKDKAYWWQMLQLLPSSYNQRRTVMLNYEVLANIYKSSRGHKLDEWNTFCTWIKSLPYCDIITGEQSEKEC